VAAVIFNVRAISCKVILEIVSLMATNIKIIKKPGVKTSGVFQIAASLIAVAGKTLASNDLRCTKIPC
jgi:hypothetical protein